MILVKVLLERLDTPFQYEIVIAVIAPVPAVQALNVFPVMVLVEPLPPSVLLKPVSAPDPETVILEKLLFV